MAARALVGRERELAAVDALIDGAVDGAGGALVVAGEPGIGKSALVAEAIAHARARGFTVCEATAEERDRELSFGIVRRLFEPVDSDLLAGAAAAAAPALGRAQPGDVPVEFGVVHGLYWLAANLAERAPVLVAVDDAQWADPPSLRFLDYLVERSRALPVALLVCTRDDGAPRGPRVRLAPLDAQAVGELVRAKLGRGAEPEFVEACREATGGNPFLLRALVDELAAAGVAPVAGAAERVSEASPESVQRDVLLRLARLGPAAVTLAQAVAILGRDAELRHAAALAGVDVAAAHAAAGALAAAAVFERGEPLRFVHPVVQAAVYADTGPAQRSGGHRRAAGLLDAEAPDRAVGHLLAVPPAGDAWALKRLLAAADRALAGGALDAARTLLDRALDEAPSGDERARVLLALGQVEERAHGPGPREVARFEAVLTLATDPAIKAETVRELFDMRLLRGEGQGARSLLEWAKRELPDPTGASWLELEASRVALLQLPASPAEAASLTARLARVEQGRDDTLAQRRLLALLAFQRLIRMQTTGAEVGRLAERALAGGRMVAEDGPGLPAVAAFSVLQGVERTRDAELHLEAAIAAARDSGKAAQLPVLLVLRGRLGVFCGRLDEAEADLREALALNEVVGARITGEMGLVALGSVLVERGDLDGAEVALDAQRFPAGGSGNRYLLLQARAALRRAQGRGAEAALDVQAADRHRTGPAGTSVLSRAMLALSALAAGDGERARRLAADAVAHAERWAVPGTLGIALRTQGLVEDDPALLARAEAALAGTPRRLEYARTLVELGAAERRAGRLAGARAQLDAGMELAHRCGATPLVERACEELVACGARPRRLEGGGVQALTPAELQVARLAAGGRSDREIAQARFATQDEIETQLGSISRKLGTPARERLTALLAGRRT